MSKKRRIARTAGAALLIGLARWFAWPVFSFYAHMGKVALPPFGFVSLPQDNLSIQWLGHLAYRDAGNRALDLMIQHKEPIRAPALPASTGLCYAALHKAPQQIVRRSHVTQEEV